MPTEIKSDPSTTEYRPVLLSRRGEFIAWGSLLFVLLGGAILQFTGQYVIRAVPFLAVFLLLAASAMSLGNWMDRRTVIYLSQDGVDFSNGPRNSQFIWDEIQQVQVLPSKWGKKVRVIGDKAYFEFRTLGEVSVQGEVKGQVGFVEGDFILETILENTGLKEIEHSGAGYYYARE